LKKLFEKSCCKMGACLSNTQEKVVAQEETETTNQQDTFPEIKFEEKTEAKNQSDSHLELKVLGVDPNFEFVPGDHHLAPSVMPLFTKGRVIFRTYDCELAEVKRKSDGENILLRTYYRRDNFAAQHFRQEYELLSKLNHPNILKLLDCYVDKENFYICMELCSGGELLQKIKMKKRFYEHEAADLIRTIIDAIAHCHARDVVHQHIVPENILFRGEDIVIVGFGGAKIVEDDKKYEDCMDILCSDDNILVKTTPECTRERYGWEFKKSDMWDVGIICFVMLTGHAPFYGKNNVQTWEKITHNQICWPSKNRLSAAAKDFLKQLLKFNAKERMTASEALEHVWLNRKDGHEKELGEDVLNNISSYVQTSKLKRVLIKMLSNQMTPSDHEVLKKQFDEMDSNGDGVIDIKELTDFIFKRGKTKEEAEMKAASIMKQVDRQGDKKITPQEWTDSRISFRLASNPHLQRSAFEVIDKDRNGYITHKELSKHFNSALDHKHILQMISEIDEKGDGRISLGEFVNAMEKKPSSPSRGVYRTRRSIKKAE